MIRKATIKDAKQICVIYNHHVLYTTVTFEEDIVCEEEMARRIESINSKFPWLVYEENNIVVGYAYASRWRTRSAYRYSAETTVYLNEAYKSVSVNATI